MFYLKIYKTTNNSEKLLMMVIEHPCYVDILVNIGINITILLQPSGQNRQKKTVCSLKECVFVNSALKIYTPTDCFFGDFAHWESSSAANTHIFL